ncbi:hypothetical protein [Actinomadura parmotrematis]|uniref:FtsK gamma domain-containing protein n=1 Tax=Actinomadura parmotrematis TaxID=2864039 RepID=A0ABS7FKA0_9ACTN|nr:hypothetical protein [Actinomadura parmotrematis]MBW8480781.1 hypothetical protein [Actinomadura parmotrematis]
MRQIRSADPWSTFLTSGRDDAAGTGSARFARREPPPEGARRTLGPDPSDACRRVLDQLHAAHGPQTFDQIRYGTGLGLLEIADAVELLRDRGLARVEDGPEEAVRLTADGTAG